MRLEHTEALREALAQSLAPVAGKMPILLRQQSLCGGALDVRRVEYDERERVVRERQACEVGQYVGIYHDGASPDCARSADVYRVRLAAFVHEQRPVICLVEPEHAASTAGVEHGRE